MESQKGIPGYGSSELIVREIENVFISNQFTTRDGDKIQIFSTGKNRITVRGTLESGAELTANFQEIDKNPTLTPLFIKDAAEAVWSTVKKVGGALADVLSGDTNTNTNQPGGNCEVNINQIGSGAMVVVINQCDNSGGSGGNVGGQKKSSGSGSK